MERMVSASASRNRIRVLLTGEYYRKLFMATQSVKRTNLLKTSNYDRAASMLTALLILLGLGVLLLLIMWLTFSVFAMNTMIVPAYSDSDSEDSFIEGIKIDQPDADVLGIDTDIEEPAFENTLAAMESAIATQMAILDNPALTGDKMMGKGGSTGDGRQAGSGMGRRWELEFKEGLSLSEYAKQLDFFGIELASLEKGNYVEYATKLSAQKPTYRKEKSDQEKRYYLTWKKGGLRVADEALLGKAGIESKGKLILKFLPPKTEQMLYQLEQTHAGSRAGKIRSTTFAIRPTGKGYQFFIVKQTYRN